MMTRTRALLLLLIALLASVFATAQNKVYESPVGDLRAVIIPVGKKGFQDLESRIEIRASGGSLIRWRSFASSDGEHGRGVNHAAWTADGEFFVFNASSSGGHQPWNMATYFYSSKANRFYSLDDFIGPVTSNFTLIGRNRLKTSRFNFDKKEEKEAVTMSLHKLVIKRDRR